MSKYEAVLKKKKNKMLTRTASLHYLLINIVDAYSPTQS